MKKLLFALLGICVHVLSVESELPLLREALQTKFEEALLLTKTGADEASYKSLLKEVKALREKKDRLEEAWRKSVLCEEASSEEDSSPWDVGEITLSQLIMEYGGTEYLYIIPQELSAMKLSLYSGVPLPRESWGEVIESLLVQNGIGAKKLNTFVKQLYIFKLDPSAIEAILSREEDLFLFPPHARVVFVLSPPPEQARSVCNFLERLSDSKQTMLHMASSRIVLISSRENIEKLLGFYNTVWKGISGKTAKIVNLTKISPCDGEKVIRSIFGDSLANKSKSSIHGNGSEDFSSLVLPQGLLLIGEENLVERGEKILQDLELQLEDPGEKVVYWYSCKHSNPDEIAGVLEQVYDSLIGASLEKKAETPPASPSPASQVMQATQEPSSVQMIPYPSVPVYTPNLPVNPAFVQPGMIENKPKSTFGNFVVDTKTASILMVVRREELSKIKNLLKRLDVPKRMVQIDVLLVEKKLTDRKQAGINILNFGSTATLPKETGVTFSTSPLEPNRGIFKFLFNRPPGKLPGFDLTYQFLMAQDDVRINANPTVLAINQTPATISIVEEISINNGAVPVPANTAANVTYEKSYTRAQYGTTIVMTPTIHFPDSDEEESERLGSVSLQTDVTFDTTEISMDDRPPVHRRHVVNEVQVADGETVILGGLRRKSEEDRREKIPFLGDLPGIGKLFGMTRTHDTSTEMFIFITPKIIRDPVEDLRHLRQEEYQKRAGDIPEFLERLDCAKKQERKKIFSNSLKMLFE